MPFVHIIKGLIEKSMRIISQIDMNKFKIQIMNGLTEFFQGNNYRLMGDMDKALECFNASLEKAQKRSKYSSTNCIN